jgi:phosphatidylglycerol:prolipoprotein diacylglycerol transferase
MYATLALGPLSLPTGPILAMLAAVLALEIAGRAGRHWGLHADDVWNTGLLALVAGMIVARLWTIIQFWPVYQDEPLLIVSLRPSGFALWPGIIAATVAAFAWMVRRALDPVRVGAALAIGLVAGAVVINVSLFLTGAVVGQPSTAPWAMRNFAEMVHPVGLYRALGLLVLLLILWVTMDARRPVRTIWLAILGYALVHLVADAFIRDATLLAAFHQSQVIALAVAVAAALALAREATAFVARAPNAPAVPLSPTEASAAPVSDSASE